MYETIIIEVLPLKITYPIVIVIVRIHSLAIVIMAPSSMALVVCDSSYPFYYSIVLILLIIPLDLGKGLLVLLWQWVFP
jgi:hypothetical protein